MVRRAKIILLRDVLALVKTREQTSITEIITGTKLSSAIAYEIVELLIQTGLIEKEMINQNRKIYKINKNGKKALRAIKRLETILTPKGAAYLGDKRAEKIRKNSDKG